VLAVGSAGHQLQGDVELPLVVSSQVRVQRNEGAVVVGIDGCYTMAARQAGQRTPSALAGEMAGVLLGF
jgi:hypothetical protein